MKSRARNYYNVSHKCGKLVPLSLLFPSKSVNSEVLVQKSDHFLMIHSETLD